MRPFLTSFEALVPLAVTFGSLLGSTAALNPTIVLDNGTFTGVDAGVANKFLGIPFAKPPVGDLRFRLPVANDPYNGSRMATSFGDVCPQQAFTLPLPKEVPTKGLEFVINQVYNIISPASEDCLSLNVWVPKTAQKGSNLPVVVWIYGGAFEFGGSNIYDGNIIVGRSIQMSTPVIYVSLNYRVSAFGFLPGKEVKDARRREPWSPRFNDSHSGGLTSTSLSLGVIPASWGESAGAISASLQMVTNGGDTEGLFRGAFMQSGSPLPVGDITNGQKYYDALVAQTNCSGATDTLQCLREAPYDKLKAAVDDSPSVFSYQVASHLFKRDLSSYQSYFPLKSLALAWLPRADGVFLKDHPQVLVSQGSVANIPFVTGDCDDEGTLFALTSLNVTTSSQVAEYLGTTLLRNVSNAEAQQIVDLYPESNFLNGPTSQFSRIAGILGDFVFQAPRRFFLQQTSGKQNTWAFFSKRLNGLLYLGSFHASDLLNVYGPGDMADYLINFVNNLDPNGRNGISWPRYSTSSPQALTFVDNVLQPQVLSMDTFRKDGMDSLTQLGMDHPY
ncbi:hypothetical protein NLI96_g4177 [Meripilus lineatus]|uniref:Carboxylesterase type B domain-containing protein n=1 Tax=Meripilus lineatus TaxID=2056292 RepID=A0AAD5YIA2_9APHY|nr:hypothetical protein NLI96_g4177 [Physisporinus lineatus]